MDTTLICLSIILALIYFYLVRKPANFPPGPTGFPIVGNLHQVGTDSHIAFAQLAKRYGPIIGFKFGPDNAICVHGTGLIRKAFNEPGFMGKGNNSETKRLVSGDTNGILRSTGETWAEQRRFSLRQLRDFGFGKSSMEEIVMDEVKEISDWLKREEGNPVSLTHRFSLATYNSIWRILTGERFDHDDAKLHKILDDLKRSAAKSCRGFTSLKPFLLFFYPSIAKLFPSWSGWNVIVAHRLERERMFARIIKEHKETLQEDHARDFVDVYLQKIRRTINPASSFHPETGEDSLKSVMADFFLAGTGSMSLIVTWLFIYLLHHPRAQEKLWQELDQVIGRNRHATLNDRQRCIYTEAAILETLRLSSIAPTINHVATKDVKFCGFDIPKGTIIFVNFHANHHDPKVWGEDVAVFRPERFLSPDGKRLIEHEAFMPFSTGRRVCMAKGFAMDTVFLFAANLALNFEVTLHGCQEKSSLEPESGQPSLSPISSTVVMKQRKTPSKCQTLNMPLES